MSAFKIKRPERKISYLPELQRISSALRRLTTAASRNHGSDCYIHSALAQVMLARLGIESKLVAGYAGLRVGPSSGDVIVHAPIPGMPVQPGGVAYHIWLELERRYLLDFSAYTLRLRSQQLDLLDGGTTIVTYCPEYIFAPKHSISTLQEVTQGEPGSYYYERIPDLEERIFSAANDLDSEDVELAWTLYNNPDVRVFGPNSY